mgnify:CR=1 FL=1
MTGLSPHQARVWHATAALIVQSGGSPTVREIAAACEFSLSATQGALEHLKLRGWITWTGGRSRTIRLTPRAPDAFHLPDNIKARLEAHCAATGDDPFAVICDAIVLHLDQADSVPVASASHPNQKHETQ